MIFDTMLNMTAIRIWAITISIFGVCFISFASIGNYRKLEDSDDVFNRIGFLQSSNFIDNQQDTIQVENNLDNFVLLENGTIMMIPPSEKICGVDSTHKFIRPLIYTTTYSDSTWSNDRLHSNLFDFLNPQSLIGSSSDGKSVLFVDDKNYSNVKVMGVDEGTICESHFLSDFFNGGFMIHSGSLSASGKMFVFSSNRLGTKGGYDLFVARYSADNKWHISNLGHVINSTENDINPRLSENDSVLYFSSNREGNYRIYYSSFSKHGQWQSANRIYFDDCKADQEMVFEPYSSPMKARLLYSEKNGNKSFITDVDYRKENAIDVDSVVELVPQKIENKPSIKGYITFDKPVMQQKIQISILDTTGALITTYDVDSTKNTFIIDSVPYNKFVVGFTGNNIFTTKREVYIPIQYIHPTYIIDVELQTYDSEYESVFDVFFEQNLTDFEPFQQEQLKRWILRHRLLDNDIYIKTFGLDYENLLTNRNQRVAFLANLIGSDKVISVHNRDVFSKVSNIEENYLFQIVVTNRKYPEYRVVEFSDSENNKQSDILNLFTIELGKDLCTRDQEKLSQLGLNSLWIDNSHSDYKYCLGRFGTYIEALNMLQKVREVGFIQSKIMIYDIHNNQLRSLSERGKFKNPDDYKNMKYYVEIKSSSIFLDRKNFINPEKIRCLFDLKGIYHYIYGEYNLREAKKLCQQLKEKGYRNAIVITVNK